ncbi:MAG: hypothetical protein QUU85_07135, partial [Candidatus Eisenbacteria bacterium]|nr:hypothetical protein [Candidatus Eisenbacteria bacterium]
MPFRRTGSVFLLLLLLWAATAASPAFGPPASGPLASERLASERLASVPLPKGQAFVDPPGGAIGPLQTIRIVSRWDSAGYAIAPDFSELEGGEAGDFAVADSGNGSYLIVYTTGPMAGLSSAAGLTIPIQATNSIQGSFTDRTLRACRNLGRRPEHIATEIVRPLEVYHPGDSLVVRTRWQQGDASGMTVTADYASLAKPGSGVPAQTVAIVDTLLQIKEYTFSWKIPGVGQLLQEGNDLPLTFVGRDALCSEVRVSPVTIDLRLSGAPALLSHRVLEPAGRGVRAGDTLILSCVWDRPGYDLRPDFSALDGTSGDGSFAVVDLGGGGYEIRHTVAPLGDLPDALVPVPVTATDPFGDRFTDNSISISRNRSTPGPVHLGTDTRRSRRVYKGNDSLVVVSRWTHPAGLGIQMRPLFTGLVPTFADTEAVVTRRGVPSSVDTFFVAYRLPQKESGLLAPDGERIRIGVVARDSLWTEVVYDSILVDLDTKAPPASPTLDPLPASTDVSHILVTGIAPEAYAVAFIRNDVLRFRSPVDSLTGRFEAEMDLVPGSNKITAWGEDFAGNKTSLGNNVFTNYITGRVTSYPTPFRPEDEISVGDPEGMQEALVQIYNLEGDVVREFRQEGGSFFEARFEWDGKDVDGRMAQPGYYLVRIHRTSVSYTHLTLPTSSERC